MSRVGYKLFLIARALWGVVGRGWFVRRVLDLQCSVWWSASDRDGGVDALAFERCEGGVVVAGARLGVAVLMVFDVLDQALELAVG